MLTVCLTMYLQNGLGHRSQFCQYGVQSAVETEDLRTGTSEISSLEERDLFKQQKTITEARLG